LRAIHNSVPIRGEYIESFHIFSGELLGASICAGIVKVTVIELSSLVHLFAFHWNPKSADRIHRLSHLRFVFLCRIVLQEELEGINAVCA